MADSPRAHKFVPPDRPHYNHFALGERVRFGTSGGGRPTRRVDLTAKHTIHLCRGSTLMKLCLTVMILIVVSGSVGVSAGEETYPRGNLLVEPGDLKKAGKAKNVVVLYIH